MGPRLRGESHTIDGSARAPRGLLGVRDREPSGPVALAQLQSTHDEYVPLDEARRVFEKAGFPKRMWVIEAEDHRFSGGIEEFTERLLEAMDWVATARS